MVARDRPSQDDHQPALRRARLCVGHSPAPDIACYPHGVTGSILAAGGASSTTPCGSTGFAPSDEWLFTRRPHRFCGRFRASSVWCSAQVGALVAFGRAGRAVAGLPPGE